MKIIWSPLAVKKMQGIVDYISEDNPDAARNWAAQVLEKISILENTSKIGRIVPELHQQEIREIIYGNYRIIYRIADPAIYILTVRNARQQFDYNEVK